MSLNAVMIAWMSSQKRLNMPLSVLAGSPAQRIVRRRWTLSESKDDLFRQGLNPESRLMYE